MAAAGAKLDAYAHNPYPLNKAETPFTGGCDHCDTITLSTLERLVARVGRAFGQEQARLADRVRLPDEPARPVPRRLEGEADAVHRRGGAARVPGAAGRHADPVPDPGRARARPLAERRPDRAGADEAVVRGAADPAGAALAHRAHDDAVGPGATRHGAQRYRLEQLRNGSWKTVGGTTTHDRGRLLHARRPRRRRRAVPRGRRRRPGREARFSSSRSRTAASSTFGSTCHGEDLAA